MDGIPRQSPPPPPPPAPLPPPLTPPAAPMTPDFTLPRFPGAGNVRLQWAAPFWEGKIPISKFYLGVICVGAVLAVLVVLTGVVALCRTNWCKIR